jgi:class 3 adenylate cyclase/predicted ATPase
MRCTKCGTESTTGRKFCAECGSPLSSRCPKCGAENSPSSTFCEDCGTSFSGNATPAATRSSQIGSTAPNIRVTPEQPDTSTAADGERKTVTALFADIKGSTELEQDLDPEDARAIIDPALKLMIDAVHRYDGYVVQSTGDGIFALFGAPVAHEDHPQRALYAALRMQEELKRYSAKLVAEGGNPLQCRVGINTGEVVVRSITTGEGHTEYTPIGHTTNLASRMQAVAPTGSIAVAESTRKLCEGYFTLKPLGPTRVKGVSEPVDVFEVTGIGPLKTRLEVAERRGLTKFVGRERELGDLKRALELAKSGQGQIVAAVAEPGVGKSRLFYEFRPRSHSGCSVLAASSISHGKTSAYQPVIELLNSYFEISSEDDPSRRKQKIVDKLLGLDRALEETLPYVFTLLCPAGLDDPIAQMDPQLRRRRTLDAAKRILVRESVRQPLIIMLEDLHWIDGESEAVLNLLADSIAMAPILMLVNYRPEYRHDWSNKSNYTQLRINTLGKESAEEVLSALLGESKDLVSLKRLIIEKTEGNPFFIEEMVQALFEQGVLALDGTVKIVKSMNQIRLPATVHDVLASRIDRLPPDEKELLQTLAVIGTEFPVTLAAAVTGKSQEDLARALTNLQLAEFIYERPGLPDVEYKFKHALTHDVAYNSVLIERRKFVHERAGAAMETLYSERLDDHLSAIAHQYSQSHNARKAIHYLRLAGAQAAQRSANRESVAYFRNALDLLRSLPETLERNREELDLLLMLGPATMTLAGYGAAQELYRRGRELCGELGDNTKLFPVLWGLWMSHASRGELQEARKQAVELLSVAEGLGNDTFKLEAHHAMWNTLMYLGELKDCLLETERGVAFYDPRQHAALVSMYGGHDPGICGKNHAAQVLWLLGYPDRALKCTSEALALAQELAHPNSLAQALVRAAMNDQACRDRAVTAKRAEVAIAVSVEHGFAQWVAMGTILRIWAEKDPTTRERDLAKMREALADWRAPGTRFFLPYFLAIATEVCCELKSVDEAIAFVAEALDLVDRTGERWYEAELHRLSGELLWLRDPSSVSAAERSFRTAIEIARKQEAKSLELRATTSLARLLAKQGNRREARAMLAPLYGWFTEGFDTLDLKDAKALLDELNA